MRNAVAAMLVLCTVVVGSAHGDLHEQIAAATRAIAVRPADAALYLARGELHRAHHDTRRALTDYDAALRLDPQLDAVRLARGRMLVEARRPGDALLDLDRVLEARPDHAEGSIVRARARAALGHARPAREDYDRALRLVANPDWFIERARLVRRSEGSAAALEGLDEAVAQLGPVVTLTLEAIECELALGRSEAALARLDRLISASGPQPHLLIQRATLLASARRTSDARAAFAAALAGIDALPSARRNTTQMRALREQAHSAVAALDSSAARRPADTTMTP